MATSIGNSNTITRSYLDSLLIETRYMNSIIPSTEFELFGKKFKSPIMTAALSHLNHFMFEGATKALAEGAKAADTVLWYGMADEPEIEEIASTGVSAIEIIKPYTDRDIIYRKIEHAKKLGLLAVGIDIDHPYGEDGSADIVDGYEMTALTTKELEEICKSTDLPVIVKGVLSIYDAREAASAGVKGMVLSHHNNRIEYAVPPLMALPEIKKSISSNVMLFVDCEIKTGMDAFKALALGATGVCIGRPLMTEIKNGGAEAVTAYLNKSRDELAKAMAYTGCKDLRSMDASIIHKYE